MSNIVVRHPLPPYYDLAWTCQMHGWRHLAPFTWSEADDSLSLALWVDGKAIDVVAWQEREALVTTIGSDRPLRAGVLRTVTGAIRRSLGLEVDTAHLHRVAPSAARDLSLPALLACTRSRPRRCSPTPRRTRCGGSCRLAIARPR